MRCLGCFDVPPVNPSPRDHVNTYSFILGIRYHSYIYIFFRHPFVSLLGKSWSRRCIWRFVFSVISFAKSTRHRSSKSMPAFVPSSRTHAIPVRAPFSICMILKSGEPVIFSRGSQLSPPPLAFSGSAKLQYISAAFHLNPTLPHETGRLSISSLLIWVDSWSQQPRKIG